MNMLESMKYRMNSVQVLKMMKRWYTYSELSKQLGLPTTVLNRYIMGRVLPNEERAREFIEFYERSFNLEDEILKRITFDEYGYFDNSSILYDTQLLGRIATRAMERFENVTKVLTSETDGIPIACHIAQAYEVDMIFTRKEKEVGRLDYVEETYIPSSMGKLMSLYLPKRSIKKGERLLIVDDVIRSGETQRALLRLAKKMNAQIAGLFAVVAIGEKGMRALEAEMPTTDIEALVKL
ncbi:MAG: phosphoribosyltransferase family protein [Candidatus Methanofastidiosa archaeon]|jgi:adenine/guanine phosphoribosyltransferase-like PRPP-binding protein|nr:phosphoribosyltransferase family protein [Candidatus Methanofastidiosa archaeon]